MDKLQAMSVMSALSQQVRFEVFRLLVAASPAGIASGDLAIATGSSPNTMSTHLSVLARAGVVTSERIGRSVVYRAATEAVQDLSAFLAEACTRPV